MGSDTRTRAKQPEQSTDMDPGQQIIKHLLHIQGKILNDSICPLAPGDTCEIPMVSCTRGKEEGGVALHSLCDWSRL